VIKKFVWEKWVDPLGGNQSEFEHLMDDEDDEDGEDESGPKPVGSLVPANSLPKMFKIMHTPQFGAISLGEHAFAANRFDFWILHTNFEITKDIRDIISKVPGVESNDVLTRYRTRVGFPRSGLFNASKVKSTVQDAIRYYFHETQNINLSNFETSLDGLTVSMQVREVRDNIDKKHDYWTIYVLPNGHMEVITADEEDQEYLRRTKTLQNLHMMIGGSLLSSD
jgi:hypothetical protein